MFRTLVTKLPLRIRLTLWVTAISAILQAAVGLVFFLYQSRGISEFFNEHLEKRTEGMIVELQRGVPGVTAESLAAMAAEQSEHAMFTGFVLTLFDAEGEELATTRMDKPRYPLGKSELQRLARDQAILFRRRPATSEIRKFEADARMTRGIARGFTGDDHQRYVLAAGTSDKYADELMGFVITALWVSFPAGVLATGLCGWFIAGIAVRPLEVIRRSAEQLRPELIDQRMRLREFPGGSSPEQNRLEEALEGARKRLAAAFAMQERFMSNVSHELKTPIAVLMTEAQTLDVARAPKDCQVFVRSSMEELRRLGSMVDSFLLLTRVREGRSVGQNKVYPINELLMESVSHCQAMAQQYQVRLEPRLCEDEVEASVLGDPALLRTMIDNLVRNAVRFSPKGRSVILSAATQDEWIFIRVRDFGAGIPEAVIGRIFDRFVQAADEARRGRGHGLGLEIAQGIAELHSGKIMVRNCTGAESERGSGQAEGCEFVITLPRARSERDVENEYRRSKTATAGSQQVG